MRRKGWFAGAIFFLPLFLSSFPAQTAAQESAYAGVSFPDGGQLDGETAISLKNGKLRAAFENKHISLDPKWQGELGNRKKRAFVELLIYRKMSVEFLLTARERIRFLGYALRMDEDPELIAPAQLRNAISSGFSSKDFPEMTASFVGPALAPITPDAPRFNAGDQREFLEEMLRQSAQILQLQAQLAHAEETKGDAEAELLTDVLPAEQWRAFCRRPRAIVGTLPLTPETASSDSLRIRAAQNEQIRRLLNTAQGLDTERLLFTPVNFHRRFGELVGSSARTEILRDVESIRKHPTNQGILAGAIVALALEDLVRQGKFNWQRGTSRQSRSDLVCINWDDVPFDQVSVRTWECLRQAYLFGIQEALKTNERALFFLLHLDQANPVETIFNRKDWMEPEREPADPDILIDKFVDLAPLFLKSDRLMQLVRARYPDGENNPGLLKDMLLHVYNEKLQRLEKREKTLSMYGWVTATAFAVSAWPEWRASFRLVAFLIAISDAVTVSLVEWPTYAYRHEMQNVIEALFMGGDGDAPVPITEKDLWDVAILDRKRVDELRFSVGILAVANIWIGAPSVFRVMRAWRCSVGGGAQAFDEAKVWAISGDFTRLMKAIEEKFPNIWAAIEAQGRAEYYRTKIERFVPNPMVKRVFPGVARKLELLGLRDNMSKPEVVAKIHELRASSGRPIAADGPWFMRSYLWKVAVDMGFVDEELKNARYLANLRRIEKASPDFRSSEARRMLLEIGKELKTVKAERKAAVRKAFAEPEIPDPRTEDYLKRLVSHVANMDQIQKNLRKQLRSVPYDDRESQSVLRWVGRFGRMGETGPYRAFRAVTAATRAGFAKLVPGSVVLKSRAVREVLLGMTERAGLPDLGRAIANGWNGTFNVPRLEAEFQRMTSGRRALEAADLYFDKRTVAKFIHQGLIQGLPITLIGDRAARKAFGGKPFFSMDEMDQTAINVTVGMVEQFLKSAIFTGAFTFPMRMRGAQLVTIGANMVLTAPQNAIVMAMHGVPAADVWNTFLDPDCILSRNMRTSFAAAFHGSLSTVRGRGAFVVRGVFENPKFGGNPAGGMSADGAAKFFVISMFDKTVLGSFSWTALTRAIGGTGTCNPIRDPFKDAAAVAWSKNGNGLLEAIEGCTGLRPPTDSDLEAVLSRQGTSAAKDSAPRAPAVRPPSEMDRIQGELKIPRGP